MKRPIFEFRGEITGANQRLGYLSTRVPIFQIRRAQTIVNKYKDSDMEQSEQSKAPAAENGAVPVKQEEAPATAANLSTILNPDHGPTAPDPDQTSSQDPPKQITFADDAEQKRNKQGAVDAGGKKRGRPRSETSQRAIKEAAAAAAAANRVPEVKDTDVAMPDADTVSPVPPVPVDQPKKIIKKEEDASTKSKPPSAVGSPAVKGESPGPGTAPKKRKTEPSAFNSSSLRRVKRPSAAAVHSGWGPDSPGTAGGDSDVYCICQRPGDLGEWMIACDSCDDWFHGSCVNLTSARSALVVKYICPRCTDPTVEGKLSKYRRRCRLPGCDRPVPQNDADGSTPRSKYCSKEHGLAFFKQLLDKAPVQRELDPTTVLTAPQLKSLVSSCKSVRAFHKLGTRFPPQASLPSESDIEARFSSADRALVDSLQAEMARLDEQIRLNEIKTRFVQVCKEHTKELNEELLREEAAAKGEDVDGADAATTAADAKPAKKPTKSAAAKKKAQKAKKDICGYNSNLSLSDTAWPAYLASLGDIKAEAPAADFHLKRDDTCLLDKRKCPRHYGWQALFAQTAKDADRFLRLERERARTHVAEIYYKVQAQILLGPTGDGDNKVVAC